jgi:hypothetical protein
LDLPLFFYIGVIKREITSIYKKGDNSNIKKGDNSNIKKGDNSGNSNSIDCNAITQYIKGR